MDDISTYRQICSAQTVQSDKKGFFNEFYMEAQQTSGQKWLNNCFAKLKSNEARVLAIFNDTEICNTVLGVLENVQPVFKEKDGTISAQRRALAEKHQLLKDYNTALKLANVAVVRAPYKQSDISMALALSSRAQILLNMSEGAAALSDLKLAANYGLDFKQSVDYYLQMARAYALMNELTRAQISLNIAKKLSDNSNCKLVDLFSQEMPNIKSRESFLTKAIKAPKVAFNSNAQLRGATSAIKLEQNADKGRFIVAAQPLATGQVVLCEQPLAACLLPAYYGSHCQHCFKRLLLPVPCKHCSGIAFCSAECMYEACESYHRFECEFLDLLLGSGMSILCYIALRIFTQAASVQSALDTANMLIANLISHQQSREASDQLQRTLMAGFLLRILQKAQYFGQRKTAAPNPTALELQVCSALLGLLQVLQYNAHEIYETLQESVHRFEQTRMVYVGAGLYGTGAYFNHECWPSVTRYFVGKQLVLATIRPHRLNEALAENYGPIFTKMHLKERQRSLRARYLFGCNCLACQENWPTLNKIDKQVRFWCTTNNCCQLIHCPRDLSKDVRCPRCRKNTSMKDRVTKLIKLETIYREAAQQMQLQNTQSAIDLFREAIDLFFEIGALPHRDTLIAQQSMMKCFADTGNTSKAMQSM